MTILCYLLSSNASELCMLSSSQVIKETFLLVTAVPVNYLEPVSYIVSEETNQMYKIVAIVAYYPTLRISCTPLVHVPTVHSMCLDRRQHVYTS